MKTKRADRQFNSGNNPDAYDPSRKRPYAGKTLQSAAADLQEQLQLPPPLPALAPIDGRGCDDYDGDDSSSGRGLRLLRLLLRCAECIASADLDSAADLLPEVTELSSPFGTPPERVAAYFSHALQSRVISTRLLPLPSKPHHPPPPPPPRDQTIRICSALQCYNSISPLIKFSHFTANQAILDALDGEDRLHVIDLDIMQGLQWPGLFHIIATSRAGSGSGSGFRTIQAVRITGFGPSLDSLEATGRRLAEFAASLGLPFEFTPLEGKPGALTLTDITRILGAKQGSYPSVNRNANPNPNPNQLAAGLQTENADAQREATVVHWVQHRLYDVTGDDLETLKLLTLLRPKLITIVEQDLGSGLTLTPSQGSEFLGRFVGALHYYSALFDALGEGGLGEDSAERLTVEQQVFGREIGNVVRAEEGEGRRRWTEELRRAGFRTVSLGGSAAAQAGLLLGMLPWNGYTLVEENGCLRLGWKDLSLLTASAWEPSD